MKCYQREISSQRNDTVIIPGFETKLDMPKPRNNSLLYPVSQSVPLVELSAG